MERHQRPSHAVVATPTVLVATWGDGLFVVGGETSTQDFVHQSVRALAPDGHGGAVAIVNGHSLRWRAPDGVWTTIAKTSSIIYQATPAEAGPARLVCASSVWRSRIRLATSCWEPQV
jgi:hypothetical protein